MGLAGPGEFDGGPGPSAGLPDGQESEVRGVRFHKGDGTETEPEYMEGFSNRPKLNRTPLTSLSTIPGEFGP